MDKPTGNVMRCSWPKTELDIAYHDTEWGKPVHDDRTLFEAISLGGAQAGLSWSIVLRKRERYRKVFCNFDPAKVARLTDKQLEKVLGDPGIIRNKLKLASVRSNARAFIEVQREFGTFDRYIWNFVGGKPIQNQWKTNKEAPTRSPESDALSKDLVARGFKFVGTTIMYATMQGLGLINDHSIDCFRHRELCQA